MKSDRIPCKEDDYEYSSDHRRYRQGMEWLISGKAAWRFMTAGFRKRKFFEKRNGPVGQIRSFLI